MPNLIKYSTASQSLALKTGNYYIGTGDVGKGPTSSTDYYNGITPPSGGYTIYLNKESGGPSIFTPANDSELILFTNKIAGTNYTTVIQCLNYFAGQSDKMVLNRDYEGIITDGLVLNLDAGFTPSYPRSGTTWADISLSGNNGTLINGPTFSGDSIVFDGTNDYVSTSISRNGDYTITIIFKINSLTTDMRLVGAVSGPGNQFAAGWWGTTFRLWLENTWNDTGFISTTNIIYILSIVQEGTDNKIYVNGNYNSVISNKTSYFNNLGFGNRFLNSYGSFFNGDIYTTQIYNRALSAAEVLQNYNATKDRYGL